MFIGNNVFTAVWKIFKFFCQNNGDQAQLRVFVEDIFTDQLIVQHGNITDNQNV